MTSLCVCGAEGDWEGEAGRRQHTLTGRGVRTISQSADSSGCSSCLICPAAGGAAIGPGTVIDSVSVPVPVPVPPPIPNPSPPTWPPARCTCVECVCVCWPSRIGSSYAYAAYTKCTWVSEREREKNRVSEINEIERGSRAERVSAKDRLKCNAMHTCL